MNTSDSQPDGQRALFAYLLGMLFFAYAFIQRVAPSVVTDELMRDFSVGAASLGILSGAYFYTYAALQLPVGLLTDRYGPRKLMAAAALACALASAGFASSESLLMASFYRALIGGAVAFGFVGTLSIITQFFSPGRFALLAGLVQTMGMIGAIAGQAPLRLLVESRGWQESFLWLMLAGLGLAILLFTVVPRRNSKNHHSENSSLLQSLRLVARNPQSWLCAGIGFGLAAPMLSFAGLWAIPWLELSYELDKKQAAALVSMLFVGWGLGSPLWGWLSDRMGKRNPVIIGGTLIALSGFVLLVYVDAWSFTAIGVLFTVTGIGGSTMIVIFGSVRESNLIMNSAAAMGLANMCVVGSGAVTQPLIGWLLEKNWNGMQINGVPIYTVENYQIALFVLVASMLLALICAILLRETNCQNTSLISTDAD
ncbi:MAG: MFS transporter [Granulosicoccus sp.]